MDSEVRIANLGIHMWDFWKLKKCCCPSLRSSSSPTFSTLFSLSPCFCVIWGKWRWEAVEGYLGVCFISLGTTLLPDNSLKTGKNATWLNDSTLLVSLSLSLLLSLDYTHTGILPAYKQNSHDAKQQTARTACQPLITANKSTSISTPHTICIQNIPLHLSCSRCKLQSFHSKYKGSQWTALWQ